MFSARTRVSSLPTDIKALFSRKEGFLALNPPRPHPHPTYPPTSFQCWAREEKKKSSRPPPAGSPLRLCAQPRSQDYRRPNPAVFPALAATHLAEFERVFHDVGQSLLKNKIRSIIYVIHHTTTKKQNRTGRRHSSNLRQTNLSLRVAIKLLCQEE